MSQLCDDEEEEYDSEDERYKARNNDMLRRRQLQREAAEEMARLRYYQAEQQATRISSHPVHAYNDSHDHCEHQYDAFRDNDMQIIAEHEEKWTAFEALSNNNLLHNDNNISIKISDVPWPPFKGDFQVYLTSLARFNSPSKTFPLDRTRIKQAYSISCLRWHPDKFKNKYGKLVCEKECSKMEEQIHEVILGITQAWAHLSVQYEK